MKESRMFVLAVCAAVVLLSVVGSARAQEATIVALTTSGKLVRFKSGEPGTLLSSAAVSGLQPAEQLRGIDFRPRTGQLYGLGSSSRLYTIDTTTGVATAVGAGPFAPALSGTDFGFDFNPTVDRIRIVSNADQNLRLNPDTGTVAGTDTALNPPDPNVVAAAYTNNFFGATSTTLFDIDSATDSLVKQDPPGDGVLTLVGPLGVDTSGLTGFDIAEHTDAAFASITASAATTSTLYTINLTTGAATAVGAIGGTEAIVDIALPTTTVSVFGLNGNELVRFSSGAPGTILATVPVTGLENGLGQQDQLIAIDFRPRTGQLYGLGSSSRLYTIDTTTGAATAVGAGPFTPALSGTAFGFDFNPTVDRIRVVSNAEQNLRLNPDTGTVVFTDMALNFLGGTPADPNVVGAAYTNNFDGATSTTLFDIDSQETVDPILNIPVKNYSLVRQEPPNDGVLTAVGPPLGLDCPGFCTGFDVGFDIAPVTGMAFAVTTFGPPISMLFTINLTTGAPTFVGPIGEILGPFVIVEDIAIPTNPPALFAVTEGNALLRLASGTPGTVLSSKPITGLQPAEQVLGIDFRPRTGQLYGLGSSSRLYTIDTATGVATAVGAGPFTPALTGTDFGFDFNPTVDRIRVVSNAGQNLRLHPDTGAVAGTDTALNYTGGTPANPNVVAAAYTNNFFGATSTTLFDIDSATDSLVKQDPPNGGVLTPVGPLAVDTSGLTGFDIVAGTGAAFVSLTAPSASTSQLYTINLTTGAATLVGTMGGGTTIRDIALNPARAGNGVLDPGEECDDDNDIAGDCCSPAGKFETGPCNDGSACTTGDTCAAGVCVGGPALTCDPCLVCDAEDGCVPPTGLACQRAFSRKATLTIVDKADPTKDTLSYKWVSSAPVPLADYGSPTSTSSYRLCIFDGAQKLQLSSVAPAGGICTAKGKPCWAAKKSSFVYTDSKEVTPDGLASVTLKAGTKPKQATIKFKGKKALLQPPVLPITTPITVRVQRSDGASCYEAVFSKPKKNVVGKLTATSD